VRFICPSCAKTNYCPDSIAGLSIVCRRCKTQITVPDPPEGGPKSWVHSRYWVSILVLEALAIVVGGVLAVCFVSFGPPSGLPLLGAESGGGSRLAVAGRPVPLEWDTGLKSAGGHFSVVGQNVAITSTPIPTPLRDVQVGNNPWDYEVFQPGRAPRARVLRLALEVGLPNDAELAGQEATLHLVVDLEYPGWATPGGPVSLQRGTVERDWSFTVATKKQQKTFAWYRRTRAGLKWGLIAASVVILAIGLAAAIFAQQHLNVTCPKCGRVTTAHFRIGGRDLYISPCPHKDSRPVG